MKKDKVKREKIENEDVKLIKKLVIILIVVIVFVLGFYFLTDKVVEKNETPNADVEINYSTATVGTILNRPYDEYMVLLYDSEESEAAYYSTLLSKYTSSSKDKVYFVDLSLRGNKEYVKDKSNKKFTKIEDAAFVGPTLLKIKDGKVVDFLESKEAIKEVLSLKD